MKRIKKAAATIHPGWEYPLLTFIYPGFEGGTLANGKVGTHRPSIDPAFAPQKISRVSQNSEALVGWWLKGTQKHATPFRGRLF